MSATIVLGTQWGDEGKGRVVDYFSARADFVVRYQGGNNAGHTIVVEGEEFALSLIPSGVMYPDCVPVIATGVLVDPAVLLQEMSSLSQRGIDQSRLRLSSNAHLILPYHQKLDALLERHLGVNRIGTTKRGIGPAAVDKYARSGIRVQDLFDQKILSDKIETALAEKNRLLTRVYNQLPISPQSIIEQYSQYGEQLTPYVTDTSLLLSNAISAGKEVLLEGAQGTLLDIDHGTYPFVTSSNPTAGGALVGTGLGPRVVERVIGVAKAYISRVGTGPFPTELYDEIGARLVERGGEFGTVTGRRRRCGWLDLVGLRYSSRINSLSHLFLTKLDVLSGLDKVQVAVGYESAGEVFEQFPRQQRVLYQCQPRYRSLPGWSEDLSGIREFSDLPVAAQDYVLFIEEQIGVPVSWISVGPQREQLIHR